MNNHYLSSQITGLTTNIVQELVSPHKHTIRDYESILRNPWAKECCNIKSLRATVTIGDYQNKNKEHQDFILDAIANMDGTLSDIVGRLCSAMPFGHSSAEIAFKPIRSFGKTRYTLKGINLLDPKRVRYAGAAGKLTHIRYNDGIRALWIPYNKCLHITNGLVTNYNERTAYGDPECETAYPYVKLYEIIFSEMAVSAKTLAVGILLGRADTENTVYLQNKDGSQYIDVRTGKPVAISAVANLAEQFQNLETHNHIVTDKRNEVSALQIPAGEQFWNLAESMLRKNIFAAFGVPSMVLDEGSGGIATATLSVKHLSILDSTVEATVKKIRDQLIEKVIRPLIIWNYGVQDDYGSFAVTNVNDPTQESAQIQNFITAFTTQVIPMTDLEAMNKFRELMKLSPTTEVSQPETQSY
jgi:hypothetical protein